MIKNTSPRYTKCTTGSTRFLTLYNLATKLTNILTTKKGNTKRPYPTPQSRSSE